jgi:hypothetical protein
MCYSVILCQKVKKKLLKSCPKRKKVVKKLSKKKKKLSESFQQVVKKLQKVVIKSCPHRPNSCQQDIATASGPTLAAAK